MSRVVTSILLIGLLAGAAPAAISMEWVLAPSQVPPMPLAGGSAPAGYTSYDLLVTTTEASIGVMELYLNSDAPDGIFQAPIGEGGADVDLNIFAVPAFPTTEYDTFVTLGWVAYGGATGTTQIGAAVDINGVDPNTNWLMTSQNIDVAWGPGGGNLSGIGTHFMARVTLKDGVGGTWKWGGYETSTGGGETGGAPHMIQEGGLPIPEPTTMLVLLGGVLAGLIRRR